MRKSRVETLVFEGNRNAKHTLKIIKDLNSFDFSDKTVKEIMTPRMDMACIFIDDSFEAIIEFTLEEQLTRYQVCRDSKDNIIGFIHIKDLYKQKIEDNNQDIKGVIREIKFIPESVSISELLKVFKKEKVQMR